jgi:hypothetical protein
MTHLRPRYINAQQTEQRNSQFKRACRTCSRHAPTLQQNAKATCRQRRSITQVQQHKARLAAHRSCSAAAHRSIAKHEASTRAPPPRNRLFECADCCSVHALYRAHRHWPRASRPEALAVAWSGGAAGSGTQLCRIQIFIPHFSPSITGKPACRTRSSTSLSFVMLYLKWCST